jgi:mannosyltransferase OCH1-like enzyme
MIGRKLDKLFIKLFMRKINRKFVIQSFIFVLCIALFFHKAITKQFKKIVCKPCHSVLVQDFLIEEGVKDPKQRSIELLKASIRKINSIEKLISTQNSIPQIIHYIYFTTSENPRTIPEQDVVSIINNINNLQNQIPGWKSFFWTNNQSIVPDKIKKLRGMVVKNISEFSEHNLYNELTSFIKIGQHDKHYYSSASDILRLIALQKYGGIYMDLDYTIFDSARLVKFLKTNDFIGGAFIERENFYIANNSFVATKPKHKIINTTLSLIKRNLSSPQKPSYVLYPCNKIYSNLSTTGMISFTAAVYLVANTKTDIYFPTRILYTPPFNTNIVSNAVEQIFEGLQYIEKPIGNDRFGVTWMNPEDFEDAPCLKDMQTELRKKFPNL